MAKYAYIDKERTKVLLAEEITPAHRGQRFYCPNKLCDAELSSNIAHGTNANYFSARYKNHIEKCFYGSQSSYNPDDYDEKLFVFNDAIEQLFKASSGDKSKTDITNPNDISSSNKKPISRLKEMWSEFKSKPIWSSYNDLKIYYMFLCEDSKKYHKKGFWGNRVTEINLTNVEINESKSNQFVICKINLNDEVVDLKICCKGNADTWNTLKNQINSSNTLIIGSKLSLSLHKDKEGRDYYYTYIYSKKQFFGEIL